MRKNPTVWLLSDNLGQPVRVVGRSQSDAQAKTLLRHRYPELFASVLERVDDPRHLSVRVGVHIADQLERGAVLDNAYDRHTVLEPRHSAGRRSRVSRWRPSAPPD